MFPACSRHNQICFCTWRAVRSIHDEMRMGSFLVSLPKCHCEVWLIGAHVLITVTNKEVRLLDDVRSVESACDVLASAHCQHVRAL